MFKLLRMNSYEIITSWQYMLKQIHVNIDWHISHVFMVHTKVLCLCQVLSHFMFIDWYQHWKSAHLVFDFLTLNFFQHVLVSTFESVYVNRYYFCHLHMWINIIFSYADLPLSVRKWILCHEINVMKYHKVWYQNLKSADMFYPTWYVTIFKSCVCDSQGCFCHEQSTV